MGKPGSAPVQPAAATSLSNDTAFLKGLIGVPGANPVQPSASTSLSNDTAFLKGTLAKLLTGTPYLAGVNDIIDKAMVPKIEASNKIIDGAILPKITAVGTNLTVLKDGGTLITSAGSVPFPASVNTVEQGIKSLSTAMAQTDAGLGLISAGVGPIDSNGQAVKVMVDGKPGTILYALSYFNSSIDSQVLPGLDQLLAGSSKIGDGSGQARTAISSGLDKMLTAPATISAMKDSVTQADSFLGKPDGAEGAVTYIYQTPPASKQSTVMYYGLGAIAIVLIILFAAGRPPKTAKTIKDANQTI